MQIIIPDEIAEEIKIPGDRLEKELKKGTCVYPICQRTCFYGHGKETL